jgi:hypothetical protein
MSAIISSKHFDGLLVPPNSPRLITCRRRAMSALKEFLPMSWLPAVSFHRRNN